MSYNWSESGDSSNSSESGDFTVTTQRGDQCGPRDPPRNTRSLKLIVSMAAVTALAVLCLRILAIQPTGRADLGRSRKEAFSSKSGQMDRVLTRQSGQSGPESECLQCPSCLDPSGTCLGEKHMVFRVHPECFTKGFPDLIPSKDAALCKRTMYRCPTTGVIATLPLLTSHELGVLYGTYYTGQKDANISHPRWTSIAHDLQRYGGLANQTGMTILEVGCAAAFQLWHLRGLASGGGKLICVEPDPDYRAAAESTFASAKSAVDGNMTTEFVASLFEEARIPSGTVDLITSSQVVEHMADTCAYMAKVKELLRPGGLVFTDIPYQYYGFNASSSRAIDIMLGHEPYPGEFHITLFGQKNHGNKDYDHYPNNSVDMPIGSPMAEAFIQSGFEQVWVASEQDDDKVYTPARNRYLFRKPYESVEQSTKAASKKHNNS